MALSRHHDQRDGADARKSKGESPEDDDHEERSAVTGDDEWSARATSGERTVAPARRKVGGIEAGHHRALSMTGE